MKRLAAFLIAIMLVFCLTSCGAAKPKTFTADGLEIELTSDFSEQDADGYVKVFRAGKYAVYVMREDKGRFGSKPLTFREYGEYLRMANATKNPSALQSEGNISYFEYDVMNGSDSYSYLTAFYEAAGAFWSVRFACPQPEYSECKARFLDWAGSVVVR